MIEKKKILILATAQFGYSTTTFKYCEYGREQFEITYVGWDYHLPKKELQSVTVKYVSRDLSLLKRNFRLLHTFHKEIQNGYDLIFMTYIRGISLIKMLNTNSKFLMYIDTLGVMAKAKNRWIYDAILKFEVSFYSNVAVISDGLAKRLGRKKYEILPLGGSCFNNEPKSFGNLELLYVGTLDNRRIIDCVKGFHEYLKKYEIEPKGISFKIIGDGPNQELQEIREYVKSNDLSDYIKLIGYVPQKELYPYFKSANIGLSYVPMVSYFEYQPPTKTFEYLISGLPVIATGTFENQKLIRPWSGVVIEDNPEAFCEGLARLQSKKKDFCSERIRKEYSKYTWEQAVISHFIPMIKKLTSN